MNLALEYMIRTGEFQFMLDFPYSVFLNNYDNDHKLVMTIYESFRSGRLAVKHWLVSHCTPDFSVPQFLEYEIDRDELFVSDRTVLPGHYPLWYREEPFEAGRKQHTDMPHAAEDEKSYKDTLDNFLNSKRHRLARIDWLWKLFSSVYNVEMKGYVSTRNATHYMALLKQFYPSLAPNWVRWRRYMLDFSNQVGQVAGELLFHSSYAKQAKLEGRPTPNTVPDEDRRWQRVEINPNPFFGQIGGYQIARAAHGNNGYVTLNSSYYSTSTTATSNYGLGGWITGD